MRRIAPEDTERAWEHGYGGGHGRTRKERGHGYGGGHGRTRKEQGHGYDGADGGHGGSTAVAASTIELRGHRGDRAPEVRQAVPRVATDAALEGRCATEVQDESHAATGRFQIIQELGLAIAF